ncbi:T9SS type B sorting domain-containing protein [uncultured Croceitalea sp.]|uniref:T9SS type B sorting domain-containing protein n=1 Tax=uncultured Croceitalea sp. TaxID=1798908 RepID=UPI00330567DD
MRTAITLVIYCWFSCCFSQQESANWYFGTNAGLNFSSGAPEPLLDGKINTIEGCSSFSDNQGNLLFYTEGRTVWNRNHFTMQNGTELRGSFSSAQAALIVPNPVNTELYYIFTPDDAIQDDNIPNGFHYTVVDMTLDNGLGGISDKNNQLLVAGSEKVSAVKNDTGNFYWVVTHFEDTFYSYRVEGAGVSNNAITSQVGPLIQGLQNIRGAIKISPNGRKLVMASTITQPGFQGSLYLFDFDVATGRVSNPVLVDDSRAYYGVEFSPDSSKLYASGMLLNRSNSRLSTGNYNIVQFDLDSDVFPNAGFSLATINNLNEIFISGALQLALDKRIYHTFPSTRLSVIRRPNAAGRAAQLDLYSVDLGGRTTAFGLPPFIQSFFETIVTIENFCVNSATTFTLDDVTDIASVSWDFGDPNSGPNNTSTELNPTHNYQEPGRYTISLEVTYLNNVSNKYIEYVEIYDFPDVLARENLVQCDVDGVDDGITIFNLNEVVPALTQGNNQITVEFFETIFEADNDSNIIDPLKYRNAHDGAVIYAKSYIEEECYIISEITLQVEPLSDLGVYDTFTICDGVFDSSGTRITLDGVREFLNTDFSGFDTIMVYDTKQHALLEENALNTTSYLFAGNAPFQLYFRIENDDDCAFIGQLDLNIYEEPIFDDTITIELCRGKAVLEALSDFETYFWLNGSTSRRIEVNETGMYEVVFANGTCVYSQTFNVKPTPEIDIDAIVINDFRASNSITFNLGPLENSEQTQFSIDGGLTRSGSNSFQNLVPGLYDIFIDNGCITYEDTVVVGGLNTFFTPNGDDRNDIWSLANEDFFPGYRISIFDRYGKMLKNFGAGQAGWDGNYRGKGMPADDYWYRLELADGRSVKGFFALKR